MAYSLALLSVIRDRRMNLVMHSARRVKLLLLGILVVTFILLCITTAKRTTNKSPFYIKTQQQLQTAHYENDVTNAMANAGDEEAKKKRRDPSPTSPDRINDARAPVELGQGLMEETLKERLRLAEMAAKKSAEEKWRGAEEAAAKAGPGSPESPGVQEDGSGAQGREGLVKDGETKNDQAGKNDPAKDQLRAVEAAAKKAEEIKRSVDEAVVRELEGKPSTIPEDKGQNSGGSGSAASSDDKAEVSRQKILHAQEREQTRLKAEFREQLKMREMERQRDAGQKINAVNPDFEKRRARKLAQQNAAKGQPDNVVLKPKAAATSKAPPVPTTPAELEFHRLLALSPVTIFSKSYCPYSLKAKKILTQAFDITPSPYVVELDKHTLGKQLQAILFDKTRRKTVPNVIVAGKSIGGGDEVESLWKSGTLRKTLKDIAGRRLVGVVENKDVPEKG